MALCGGLRPQAGRDSRLPPGARGLARRATITIWLPTWEGNKGGFLRKLSNLVAEQWLRFRRWLTVRRMLAIVALLVLVLAVLGLLEAGVDIGFLFGLDLGLVAEVTALLIIFSVRGHIKTSVTLLPRRLLVLRRPLQRLARAAGRARPLCQD